MNAFLCDNIAAGKFISLFYGILDAGSHQLEYCNAGHLPPVVIQASGDVRRPGGGGVVLGVFRNLECEDSQIDLEPGDTLLLFTDGITEAFGPGGEEFGEGRIAATALAHRGLPAQELNDLLLAEVSRFCGAQFHDDATLLTIAATGANRQREQHLI